MPSWSWFALLRREREDIRASQNLVSVRLYALLAAAQDIGIRCSPYRWSMLKTCAAADFPFSVIPGRCVRVAGWPGG